MTPEPVDEVEQVNKKFSFSLQLKKRTYYLNLSLQYLHSCLCNGLRCVSDCLRVVLQNKTSHRQEALSKQVQDLNNNWLACLVMDSLSASLFQLCAMLEEILPKHQQMTMLLKSLRYLCSFIIFYNKRQDASIFVETSRLHRRLSQISLRFLMLFGFGVGRGECSAIYINLSIKPLHASKSLQWDKTRSKTFCLPTDW